MKRFFDENDQLNIDGENYLKQIGAAIEPLCKKYAEAGYSIRDIAYLFAQAFHCLTLPLIIAKSKPKVLSSEQISKIDIDEKLKVIYFNPYHAEMNKILTIKKYRELTGASLRESKDYIEHLFENK